MSTRPAAININPGEHLHWHVAGLTLDGDTIISTVVAGLIIIGLGFWLRASYNVRKPKGIQLVWETVTDQVEKAVEDSMGVKVAPFVVPLSITLFLFILISNWLSLLPSPHSGTVEILPPPAADVNLTYALAILVIVWMHIAGVRRQGLKYYGHLFRKPYALVPLNLLEELMKPVTLALRLFGNIFSGTIMVALIAAFPAFVLWLPTAVWKLFDGFIGLIQAFIFGLLTVLYFSSIAPHDDHAASAAREPAAEPAVELEKAATH